MAKRARCPTFGVAVGSAVALGFAVRILTIFAGTSGHLAFTDSLYYHLQAITLADGHGFVDPIAFSYKFVAHATAQHPPLFSLVLAGVTKLGLSSVRWHQTTCAVLSSAGVGVLGFVGRKVAGARAGIVAAFLAALYPPLWVSDGLVLSESLLVFIFALTLLAILRWRAQPTTRHAIELGLCVGAATMTRAEIPLFIVLFAAPMLFVRSANRGRRLRSLALAALVAVVCIAPWAVRNLVTFNRTVVLSDNLDWVIGGANCPATYEGTGIGTWDINCSNWSLPSGDESNLAAGVRFNGGQYALHHVGRWPVVAAARVGRTWEVFKPMGDAGDSGRHTWTEVLSLIAFYPMQLAAIIVIRRHGVRKLWPFVACAIGVTVLAALTYGVQRFRLPWDIASVVLVCMLAARPSEPASNSVV